MKKYTFYKPQHGGQVYKCTPHTLKKDSVWILSPIGSSLEKITKRLHVISFQPPRQENLQMKLSFRFFQSKFRPQCHTDHVSLVYITSQVVLVVKTPPANAGDTRDATSVPGLGRVHEEWNGSPLWYSCLENSMDRGAWPTIVHGIAKSWTHLSDWTHSIHDLES